MVDWKTDVDWAKTALVVANLNKRIDLPLRTNIRRLIDAAEHAKIPAIFVRVAEDSAEATLDEAGLDPRLRAVGRESLIIAGDVTETVLELIMRDAFVRGFNCVVATDATTAKPGDRYLAGADHPVRNLAWHGETRELVTALADVAPIKPGLAEALAAC